MRASSIRIILFILCLPSGTSLLFKSFGLMEMQVSGMFLVLPSLALLLLLWLLLHIKKDPLSKVLLIGFWAGLIGTLGYDIVRIPYWLMGHKVFAPIRMYGMWLTDASSSNRLTDLIGWLYHFSNGITFGIAYLLVMRYQRIWWALLYAISLETVFLLSPFGELFGLIKKPMAIVFAYIGHIAYGYPLGYMAKHFELSVRTSLYFRKTVTAFFVIGIFLGIIFFTTFSYNNNSGKRTLQFTRSAFRPFAIRIDRDDSVTFFNNSGSQKSLVIPTLGLELLIEDKEKRSILPGKAGIFFVHLKNENTDGGFILCEPVEQFNK